MNIIQVQSSLHRFKNIFKTEAGFNFRKFVVILNSSYKYLKMKKLIPVFLAMFGFALFLTSCATHSLTEVVDPPGFLKGLLHGFILLFSFIGSLFTDYEIYAIPNSGGWYDFGFVLGVMFFFGGGGAGAKKRR